mmetsp:Transcript_1390/g.4445  ORF Transcript_1390/g.4445 Transcript_1390/m.4445 type:complete len:200 (-) Transcript_1390:698-1297(-)
MHHLPQSRSAASAWLGHSSLGLTFFEASRSLPRLPRLPRRRPRPRPRRCHQARQRLIHRPPCPRRRRLRLVPHPRRRRRHHLRRRRPARPLRRHLPHLRQLLLFRPPSRGSARLCSKSHSTNSRSFSKLLRLPLRRRLRSHPRRCHRRFPHHHHPARPDHRLLRRGCPSPAAPQPGIRLAASPGGCAASAGIFPSTQPT